MNILVFGANGLLGRTAVEYLSDKGCQVWQADINFDTPVQQGEQRIIADICNPDSIAQLFEQMKQDDICLNGAVNLTYPRNSSYGAEFFSVSHQSFCENLTLHLGSYFEFSKQCAAYTKNTQQPFSLVNFSSIYGVVAPKFDIYKDCSFTMPVEYAAIKSALIHLNKYIAAYMKNTGFRINSVSPGGILDAQPDAFLEKYNQQCLSKGMLDKQDIMGAMYFLLSEDARYMNGQNLVIDDGFSL